MDGVSVAASVIAIIQLSTSCLKLSSKWLGPSEFDTSELGRITSSLYAFNGAMKNFQTHLEINEDNEARLKALDQLKPVLQRCEAALNITKEFMERAGFVGRHLLAPRSDRKIKLAIKMLDDAKELFVLAIHHDHLTILTSVEQYLRNVGADIRDLQTIAADSTLKQAEILDSQSRHFQQAEGWQLDTSSSLQALQRDVNITRRELLDGRDLQMQWQQDAAMTASSLQDSVKRQDERADRSERQAILDWITTVKHASQQHDFLSRRETGTGTWFINSSEYQTWLAHPKQTLYCPGIPGAGKTILVAATVHDLESRFDLDLSVGIGYVYFNFRRLEEQKPEALLSSLLKQLVQKRRPLPACVMELYEKHTEKQSKPLLSEISQVLELVVSQYSRVFILADALDECSGNKLWRESFLKEMRKLQDGGGANFLATSRPIPEIETHFSSCPSLEILASNEDVCIYLEGRMSQLPSFVLNNQILREQVKSDIATAVDGMFLLAQLYMTSLEDKTTVKAVKSAVANFKKQTEGTSEDAKVKILAQVYDDAMTRIQGQKSGFRQLADNVLTWIVFATRPLNTAELQHALTVEVGEHELDDENTPQVEDMVSVCAGLVTVDEESKAIRLVHYTTQEYFLRTQEHWFPSANERLATVCLTYLSLGVFSTGFCESNKDFEHRVQTYPLYTYASVNWSRHVGKSTSQIADALRFLAMESNVESASQALFKTVHDYPRVGAAHGRISRRTTGFHLAVYFRLLHIMEEMISRGYDPNIQDSHGQTPLSYAADSGYEAGIRALLKSDILDCGARAIDGMTPLMRAAEKGHEAAVIILLNDARVEASLNDTDKCGRTAILHASQAGRWACVGHLLDKGADLTTRDNFGQTVLLFAAQSAPIGYVEDLLDACDISHVESPDNCNLTPLRLAAALGRVEVVDLLRRRFGPKIGTPVIGVASHGRRRVIRDVRQVNHDVPSNLLPVRIMDDALSLLEAAIVGPEGTPYEMGIFRLQIYIPDRYPLCPPTIRFVTPIYHPNVDENGNILLSIFEYDWNPVHGVLSLLMSILLVLGSPIVDYPRTEAARQYRADREGYDRRALEMTWQYAISEREET
ncbi:ubiquitin-conjugating enzyme E2 4 [Cladorrhinum sp. PSN259]|nr:ubiquitin-conjugating enzyme E2 4 [Cladorrhinum sp. PSN259]